MWKNIIYKEWIKMRWAVLLSTLFGLLAVIYIILIIRYGVKAMGADSMWYSVMFNGYIYFKILMIVPPLIALVTTIAQYFPETVNKRIKLTFHLPFNENGILMRMHLFGIVCLLLSYFLITFVFLAGSRLYFPYELVRDALITVLPWFLGGFAIYFLGALIILEPLWLFKVIYSAVSIAFIFIYYLKAPMAAYSPVLISLFILTCCITGSLLFSGYRFRKGEM